MGAYPLDEPQMASLEDLLHAARQELTPAMGVDDFALDTLATVISGIRSGRIIAAPAMGPGYAVVSAGIVGSVSIDLENGKLVEFTVDDGGFFEDYEVYVWGESGMFVRADDEDPRRDRVAEIIQNLDPRDFPPPKSE